MSVWDTRVTEHRVWNEMRNLGPIIDQASAVEFGNENANSALERIRTALTYIGKRLAAADPFLVVPATLEDIANGLGQARGDLQNAVNTKNFAYIGNANSNLDRALFAAAQAPNAMAPEELGGLVASVNQYRAQLDLQIKEADEARKRFINQATVFNQSVEELRNKIEAERQRLSQVTTDYQSQFSTAQEARAKEFIEALRTAQQDVSKIISDYQGQFSSAQDTRSKEFRESLSEYEKRLSAQDAEFTKARIEFIKQNNDSVEVLRREYEGNATKVLTEIDEKRKYVEDLVGVIGNLGVTSGYLTTANESKRIMWGWQGTTVLSLVALAWMAFKTLGMLEDAAGHFSWPGFAGRVVFLASLGVLAAYSGVQADKLFTEEKRNRKMALELEAIGPYLAPLPVEEQNKFRLEIGRRSFGKELEAVLHRKSPTSIVDAINSKQAQDALEILLALGKKATGTDKE